MRAAREHKSMKMTLFAAALAALTLASVTTASAQDYRRGGERGDQWRRNAEITIRTNNGRQFDVERGDRLFYRLLDRPFSFRPGMTYAYTDRCNRAGCIVFVFDGHRRRPVDRIFAPHLPNRMMAYREARDFDRDYNRFGRYDRDDRNWQNDHDRDFRNERDGRRDDQRDERGPRGERDGRGDRQLEGGPRR